jgi:hypothetical protein
VYLSAFKNSSSGAAFSYDGTYAKENPVNVSKLDEKGYVDREKDGNRFKTELSTTGRMWVEMH